MRGREPTPIRLRIGLKLRIRLFRLSSCPVFTWATRTPTRLPSGGKAASLWSPARRRIVEQAYGQWLAFLDRNGALDPSCTPGERATEPRLRAFVTELQAQVAPVSASMIVGALLRMLAVLEPDRDWTFLSEVYRHLKRTAVPSRDKLSQFRRPICSSSASG